jgi:hypothetical protein
MPLLKFIRTKMIVTYLSTLVAAVVHAANTTKYDIQTPPLTTDWTYAVGTNAWFNYPRPQLQRSQWQNLNGIWQYRNASSFDSSLTLLLP